MIANNSIQLSLWIWSKSKVGGESRVVRLFSTSEILMNFGAAEYPCEAVPVNPTCLSHRRHPSLYYNQHQPFHIVVVESSSYQDTLKMAAPEVHHLFHHPIADHSFSADRQTLAVARDTSVELYGRTGAGFKLKDELKGHDKTVTSVDIALDSGRIVTCSQGQSTCLILYLQKADVARPECSRLGTIPNWIQTNPRASANQSSCNICALVSL